MKILVVEPNVNARGAVVSSLLRCGCDRASITEATDASTAMPSNDFAVVAINADSLREHGASLFQTSDRARSNRGRVVLAITENRAPEQLAALFEAGADDCLTPPIDEDRLAAMVVLAKRRAAATSREAPEPARADGPPQANEELMAICDGMVDGILVTEGTRSPFIRANAAICRMTGYSEEELLRMTVEDLHPNEALPETRERFRCMGEDSSVRAYALPLLRKDGSIIYCDLAAKHVNYHGRRYCIGFFRDVTTRLEVERAMARSEARFRAMFEGAALGVALVDLDARFVESNESYARLTGYSRTELIGRSVADVTHPADWPNEERRLREFVEGDQKTIQYDKRIVHRDGGTAWIRASVSLLRNPDGSPEMFLGMTENISDRVLAEQALSESEETLRGLVENIPDMVIILDDKWTVQYVNRENPFISTKELIGQPLVRYLRLEYLRRCEELMQEAARTREVQTLDIMSTFDQWWSCRLVPMIDRGEVRNFMVIATDITQRKRVENSLREEQELLRKLLDLFERDRELVAFEIHDGFSQQLAGALLHFEAAAEAYKAVPATVAKNFENGIRLLRESMAESRRLVRGLRPPVLDEYGIVPAIEHLIEDHLASGGAEVDFASGVAIRRLARPLESALFRIVQETLGNIRRHSKSKYVRIELRQVGEFVRLTVRDMGVGFDPDKVGTDRFGLRGIRERARLLGGEAQIHSRRGQGTTVVVNLPMIEGSTPSEAE